MNFKEMNESDYQREKARANKKQLSPFARFCLDLKGYQLLDRGMPIFKFEAWWRGFRNADYIIEGKGNIKVVSKLETTNQISG